MKNMKGKIITTIVMAVIIAIMAIIITKVIITITTTIIIIITTIIIQIMVEMRLLPLAHMVKKSIQQNIHSLMWLVEIVP